jgi:TonB dependent receptor/Carboxypeptidase regulatory-like domain/TonB-dependent Receptor Plug Domain
MIGLLHVLLIAHAAAGATIQGTVRVVGSLQPIPNATVSIAGLNRSVVADAKGFFVIADIPAGTWEVAASAPSHASNTVTIVAGETGTIRLDFELELRPFELDPVEVQAEGTANAGSASRPPPSAGPPAARVTAATIRAQPGLIEADVLRALQVLPSVTAMSDFSTALYVRGGAADQNLITLDGIPLFNPYHVGGIFSAIGADAVSSVDVWAGAFPAPSAGDRLSSVVQIHTREGGRDQVRTSGALGLLSAHTTIDGPLGRNGSFLFSGRRTYIDAVSDAAYGVGIIDNTMPYGFSDAYLKATHGVGPLGTLTLSGYLDLESVRMPDRMRASLGGNVRFGWGARMLALAYRQPLSGSLLLEARAGYSGFNGDFDAWEYDYEPIPCEMLPCERGLPIDTTQVVEASTTSRDILAGADLTWYGRDHTVRFGGQVDGYLFEHYVDLLEEVDSDLLPLFSMRSQPTTVSAYVEDRWALSNAIDLRAGLRLLHAGRLGTALMPRLGLRWQATPRLALSAGGGSYAQSMRSLRNDESILSSFIAYDLIASQPESIGLSRSRDVVLGAEWSDDRTLVGLDAYARRLSGLVVPFQADDPMDAPVVVTDSFRVGTGRAHGVELSAAHRRGVAELSLAYAFSVAELTAGDDLFNPRFERRHQLDVGANLTWPRTVLGARLALGTGQPYTEQIGLVDHRFYDPSTGQWSQGGPRFVRGEHNGARLPGYLRLDIAARRSFEKRWFGQDGVLTPYVQILNVLNTRNVLIGEADSFGRPELSYLPQLPFLPTFGIEWRF